MGAWTLEALLSSGPAGQVWRVAEEGHAVCVLTTAEAARSLAKLLEGLDHAGLPRVIEVGADAVPAHVVLAVPSGPTLSQVLHDGSVERPEATRIARDLARALAHAHARATWNLDLRANSVVCAAEGAILHDWCGAWTALGGARALDAGPEPRVRDLQALGTLLHRMLAGRAAMRGVLDPGPTCSDELRAVVQDLTSAEPPTAREVAFRLDTLLANDELDGDGPPPLDVSLYTPIHDMMRGPRPVRMEPTPWWLQLGAAALAGLGALGVVMGLAGLASIWMVWRILQG